LKKKQQEAIDNAKLRNRPLLWALIEASAERHSREIRDSLSNNSQEDLELLEIMRIRQLNELKAQKQGNKFKQNIKSIISNSRSNGHHHHNHHKQHLTFTLSDPSSSSQAKSNKLIDITKQVETTKQIKFKNTNPHLIHTKQKNEEKLEFDIEMDDYDNGIEEEETDKFNELIVDKNTFNTKIKHENSILNKTFPEFNMQSSDFAAIVDTPALELPEEEEGEPDVEEINSITNSLASIKLMEHNNNERRVSTSNKRQTSISSEPSSQNIKQIKIIQSMFAKKS
jgi:predicted RNA-binding protein